MFRAALLPLVRPALRTPILAQATRQHATSASSLLKSMNALSISRQNAAVKSLASTQIRGMKVRSSVKKLCDGCKVRKLIFDEHSCWLESWESID